MSAQRFGALDLVANTDTVLMIGNSGMNSTVNVRFVNRNSSPIKVRLAMVDDNISPLASIADEDYLEFDTEILANEVLEDTGLAVPEEFALVVRSDTNDVTCVAFGYEEQIV